MKKLIAMLLCFAMVAALGATAAFAAMPDPVSAYDKINNKDQDPDSKLYKGSRAATEQATKDANDIKILDEIAKAVAAYEKVKFDSSKSETDVANAKKALDSKLDAIDAKYAKTVDVDKKATVKAADYKDKTSTDVADAKSAKQKDQVAQKLQAAKLDLESAYYLTTGTKMDYNAWVIGTAKLQAAADLTAAQTAAASAKTAAAKAQADAKALIADSIKVAQDAAATAVANAQKDAYNTLASNYADAVEAFWDEVATAWGF